MRTASTALRTANPALRAASALLTLLLLVGAGAALAGCGQKGALYLPDSAGEVVTRPTQTQPAAEPPATASPAPEPDPRTKR
jgi:predicted small lipoprotein YifL